MIDVTEDQLRGGLTNKECLGLTGGFEFGMPLHLPWMTGTTNVQ